MSDVLVRRQQNTETCPQCGVVFSCAAKMSDKQKRRRFAWMLELHLHEDCTGKRKVQPPEAER